MRQDTKVIHTEGFPNIEPLFRRAAFDVKAAEDLPDGAKTDCLSVYF